MHEFKTSVLIDRPADEVFALVGDLANVPRYDPQVKKSEALDDQGPRVGARFAQEVRAPGVTCLKVTAELTQFEPGHVVGFRSQCKGVVFHGALRVEPVGTKTELTFTGHVELHGLSKLAGPVIRPAIEHHAAENLKRVKALLEPKSSPRGAVHGPAAPSMA